MAAVVAENAGSCECAAVHPMEAMKMRVARIVRQPSGDVIPQELPTPPAPLALPDFSAALAVAVGTNRTAFLAYRDGAGTIVKQFSGGAWRAVGPALPDSSALQLAVGRRSLAPIAAARDAKGRLVAYLYKE
ncbi:hypothetical protein ABPG75_000612 [Micractinium tetrahymenae]